MYRIGKEEVDAVARVVESRELFRVNPGHGEAVTFEKEMQEKFGVKYALCLTSGTAALVSILTAMGVGPGDEVIVPSYTFMSTPMSVLAVGAIPVMCAVDESMTMDPIDMEKKISKRTKVLLPVHMCGFPCDMDRIMEIAKKHNLMVLEDACQADGGSYKGKRLGSIGDAGALSFNFYKIISAGEGGAILSNNAELFERALIYHDVGCPFWAEGYDFKFTQDHFVGQQYRTNDLTAAILRVQLSRLDGILADLRRVKKTIMTALKDIPGIKFNKSNDIEGDCGVQLPFFFETEEKARKFATYGGGMGYLPYDSPRHVFIYWDPILNKKGAYDDRMNPYLNPLNAECNNNITKDACPQSLDLLRRTVFVAMNPDWTEQQVADMIEKCKKAVE